MVTTGVDKDDYRHRHHVEKFFQRIKRLRRIATRYDKLAEVFLNFILLAASLDWISSFRGFQTRPRRMFRKSTKLNPKTSDHAQGTLMQEIGAISRPVSKLLNWMESKSRLFKLGLGFVPIILIGVINYHKSPQISTSLFYLLPILFVTHFTGRTPGIAAAVLATGLWLLADTSGPTIYSDVWVPCWNAVMRFGVFLIVVWLLSSMRELMNSLERRVEQRTEQLHQESAERRELEKRILEISEREQARMGQDLHDGLCQHLVGTSFSVNLLHQKLVGDGHPEAGAAAKIANLLDESITQARRLARGLYPVRIEDLGLATALEELCETMQAMFHVECGFKFQGEAVQMDQLLAVHLYRIAQEAVTNSVKHANPNWVRVLLQTSPAVIGLRVEDDGAGMEVGSRRSGGLGLRIMEFRARMIGASFQIEPRQDGGTVVICAFALPKASFQHS